MQALEAVADALKWRRQQEAWSQAEVAEKLTSEGMKVDHSAVARIERGERDVRVGELLAIAAGVGLTPGELVVPKAGRSLDVGSRKLSETQVLEWFSGNREALIRPMIKSVEELREDAQLSEGMAHLVEELAFLIETIKRRDRPAVIFGATHMHATLGALTQWMISSEDMTRIGNEYEIPGEAD